MNHLAQEILAALRTRSGEHYELYSRHINPALVRLMRLTGWGKNFVRGEGCELIDDAGARYLDVVSGYGCHNAGHNHPLIRDVIAGALAMDLPSFSQVECSIAPSLAAEELCSILPPGVDRVHFTNSGSEAVDAALKLARTVTGRKRIICCAGGFHGSSLGVLALTDNDARRNPVRPLVPGAVTIPYNDPDALEDALRWKDAAAFVLEPVLGEGGAVPAHDSYPAAALELCHAYGALLIADEVQTGLGRTGAAFACNHYGITPDIITMAKSLGGGYVPVGAMAARGELFDRAYGTFRTCLNHKNTFGGGVLAMAAVMGMVTVLREERLAERAAESGAYLINALRDLAARHRMIRSVQGRGLLIGIGISDSVQQLIDPVILPGLKRSAAELYAQYVSLELMRTHRIVAQVAANDNTVIKIMPPLIVSREMLDRLVAALDAVFSGAGFAGAALELARAAWDNR